MKTAKLATLTKNIILTITAALMMFSFSSCATKAVFLTSSIVPAARGTVSLKTDKNNNYVIKIQLYNLAEPARLTPSKNTYVVWMVTEDNITKNIGQIISSTAFLSHQLKGSFQTVSSFKPAKIFITAEYDANIQSSVTGVILSTDKL